MARLDAAHRQNLVERYFPNASHQVIIFSTMEYFVPVGVLPFPAPADPPTPIDVPADSNVEMTWQVFGGEAHEPGDQLPGYPTSHPVDCGFGAAFPGGSRVSRPLIRLQV
jgi:hypothetical protein